MIVHPTVRRVAAPWMGRAWPGGKAALASVLTVAGGFAATSTAPSPAIGQQMGVGPTGLYEHRDTIVTVNRLQTSLIVVLAHPGRAYPCLEPGDRIFRFEGRGPTYRGQALLADHTTCTVSDHVAAARANLRRRDGLWTLRATWFDAQRRPNRVTFSQIDDVEPCADGDGDGLTDADERLAGSEPDRPNEALPIPPATLWWPPYDPDSLYAQRPALGFDGLLWLSAAAAANTTSAERPIAAGHLFHYLRNTGTPRRLDVDRMLRDLPHLRSYFDEQAVEALAFRVRRLAQGLFIGTSMTFAFADRQWDSQSTAYYDGWTSVTEDWFIAVGSFNFLFSGVAEVTAGDPPSIRIRYRIHVADLYDWEGLTEGRVDPINETFKQLHRAGLARYFIVEGSSSEYEAEYESIFLSAREEALERAQRRETRRLGGAIRARLPCR